MKYQIKVIPGAKKINISYQGKDIYGVDVYKVSLTAKPIDGQANNQLIQVLSDFFKIPKYKIKIISGTTSRQKLIEITD